MKQKKEKSLYIISLLLNIIFLLIFLLFFNFQYETNDDIAMSIISYNGDEHLVFINVIIGKILLILNNVSSVIPWYPILMVICLFTAYFMITNCILEMISKKFAIFVICLILSFFGYYTYCTLQFTEVAGVLSVAGIFSIINNVGFGKKWYKNIIPIIICVLGSCYRKDMFLLVLATSCVYLLATMIENFKKKAFYIQGISILIVLFLFLGITNKVNDNAYSSEDWKYYVDFNYNRSVLLDNGMPSYDDNKVAYDKLGIKEDDLTYYSGWDFADPDLFNLKTTSEIISMKPSLEKTINVKNAILFIKEITVGLLNYEWIGIYLLSFILCLCYCGRKSYLLLIQILIAICINAYFYFRINRYLMSRVDICIVLCFTLTNFLLLSNSFIGNKNEKELKRVIFLPSVILIIYLVGKISIQQPIILEKENKVYQQIAEDETHLYLRTTTGTVTDEKNTIWVRPQIESDNVYLLGGWRTYTPTTLEILENYHVKNPFKEVTDSDNIYIEGENRIDDTVSYIKRHYNPKAKSVLVKDFGAMKIYKIISKNIVIDEIEEKPDNIVEKQMVEKEDQGIFIECEAYLKNRNSYLGEMYAVVQTNDGEITECLVQKENENYEQDDYRRYDTYYLHINYDIQKITDIKLYYKYENIFYEVSEIDLYTDD